CRPAARGRGDRGLSQVYRLRRCEQKQSLLLGEEEKVSDLKVRQRAGCIQSQDRPRSSSINRITGIEQARRRRFSPSLSKRKCTQGRKWKSSGSQNLCKGGGDRSSKQAPRRRTHDAVIYHVTEWGCNAFGKRPQSSKPQPGPAC